MYCTYLPSLSVPDVDECLESPAVCDGQGVCENTLGSYKCVCRPGYRGNGTHCEGKQLMQMSLHGKTLFPVDRVSFPLYVFRCLLLCLPFRLSRVQNNIY